MQKIAILYDASQAVMSTFDLDQVLQSILDILRDYFQLQNAAIMLIDPADGCLIVRSHFGRKHTDTRIAPGTGIVGTAFRLKRPVYVPDVSKDTRYIMGSSQTCSELAIPLMVRDQAVGVLDMQSDHLDFFDSETIDLLTLFSTQASIALENSRLYSAEQRRARQMEAINAIARQTTALVDLDELLHMICAEVLERFSGHAVSILLMDGGVLRLHAQFGKLKSKFKKGEVVPLSGLASRSLATSEAILVNDVTLESGYVAGFDETLSELCVPLIFFGEKLGVMAVDSAARNAFQPADASPLESVADICAAAIQNARHFERTQQLAYLDGLTGIFNRRFFELRIREEIERAQRYHSDLAVIMLDIDSFKKLNDEFGHLLGDEVLRQVSVIFQQQLRTGDVVCRFGGEEFAVLLPQTAGENAMEVAEKLRRTVETFHFPGVPHPVTVSGGVADSPKFGRTRDEIVAAADNALYAAKQAGRNRVLHAARSKQTSA